MSAAHVDVTFHPRSAYSVITDTTVEIRRVDDLVDMSFSIPVLPVPNGSFPFTFPIPGLVIILSHCYHDEHPPKSTGSKHIDASCAKTPQSASLLGLMFLHAEINFTYNTPKGS